MCHLARVIFSIKYMCSIRCNVYVLDSVVSLPNLVLTQRSLEKAGSATALGGESSAHASMRSETIGILDPSITCRLLTYLQDFLKQIKSDKPLWFLLASIQKPGRVVTSCRPNGRASCPFFYRWNESGDVSSTKKSRTDN